MSSSENMTLKQIQREKLVLEGAITDLLATFQKRTGISIYEVNLRFQSYQHISSDRPLKLLTGVETEVQL